MKKINLTGVKPTGDPHIGNYFGAIKPVIDLSNNSEYESYIFIADFHALNSLKDRQKLQQQVYAVAATYLACGLNPDKVTFYKQSDIKEIFELNYILACVTPKGLMNRAHAYKAIVDDNIKLKKETDDGVNMGLYTYPVLMAADILIMQSDIVPVGEDQRQHVEIARDIAVNFNNAFGNVFNLPSALIQKDVGMVIGLDGRKMSKSYNNTIQLFATPEILKKQIFSIVTDSLTPQQPKSLDSNIFKIFKLFANNSELKAMEEKFKNGVGYGEVKNIIFDMANKYLTPMREKYNYYINNKAVIDNLLNKGREKAQQAAQKSMELVRKRIM
jgi:tryptophanyl-tRNA synthetase